VRNRVTERLVTRDVIGAIAPVDLQPGEVFDDARQVAAGRLDLDGRRNRVAVVFHEVENRKGSNTRGVQRFPELTLARRPFPNGDECHLITLEFGCAIRNGIQSLVQTPSFRDANAMQALRRHGAARRRNMEPRIGPVGRHLTSAGCRIVFRSHGPEQHFERRDAERERERAVAVVGQEPVVRRAQMPPGRDEYGFVSGAADLEERLALVLELYLLVVDLRDRSMSR
jgi:hypothetical protein